MLSRFIFAYGPQHEKISVSGSDSGKNRTISKSKKLENELIRTSNETCYFENMQYFNIRYKILPTPFQYYSSYRLLNVVHNGGEIQCLNYLLCDILKHSLYLRPPGNSYCKQIFFTMLLIIFLNNSTSLFRNDSSHLRNLSL